MNRRRPSITTCCALVTLAVELALPNERLCPDVRRAFRLDTTPGRVALVVGWSALTWWFLPHLIKGANAFADSVVDALTSDDEETTDA